MKIENIKDEFPIFDEKIQNNDLVYLDSANSSQKPKVVADKINEFYTSGSVIFSTTSNKKPLIKSSLDCW